MVITKKFTIVFLLLLSVGSAVWSQVLPTTPPVYVASGGTIYAQTAGTFTQVFKRSSLNFESLAIGPDNVDTDAAGNATYAYFLYACDPTGTIIRIAFLPGANPAAAGFETVYNNSMRGLAPVCGQPSSAGDFYITNKAGSGVFVFSGIASVPFGTLAPSSPKAVALNPALPHNMTGRGITQKYVGDLLMVDNFNNQVLRSPYAVPFATESTFINTNLKSPVGIATALTTTANPLTGVYTANSNFFVANSDSSVLPGQAVSVFTQTGAAAGACPFLNLPAASTDVPNYLASAPTDQIPANNKNTVITNTIYLVTSVGSGNSGIGKLWTWNTAQADCNLNFVASIGSALSGVAVGPAPVTLTLQEQGTAMIPVPTDFNFNSSLFQFTAGSCVATVTAYPRSQATVTSSTLAPYATNLVNPVTPVVYLGDRGFITSYRAINPSCSSVFPDLGFVYHIYGFVDNGKSTNPRILDCSNTVKATEPQLVGGGTSCVVPPTIGVYPLGGPIPADYGTGSGTKNSGNFYTLVNENAGAGTAEPGTFCGFQPDLTGDGTTLPNPIPSFSAGTKNTIAVKFKLSSSANCKSNFITDANALLSVAQILDANGNPAFQAINPNATSSSIDQPPIFPPGNPQYSFTLNLKSIFAQVGGGTFSVTVTFLSDNTTDKITEFQLTQ